MYADERYRQDVKFKTLVDHMYTMIRELQFTPTEIREAAMLAQIKYEQLNPRPFVVSPEMEERLRYQKITEWKP